MNTEKELQISACYLENDGEHYAALSISEHLRHCEDRNLYPYKEPEYFESSPEGRHELVQKAEEVRKQLEIRLAYVDRDAINNRERRIEDIRTCIRALTYYVSIRIPVIDGHRLVDGIIDRYKL